jgi:hypothetical protein
MNTWQRRAQVWQVRFYIAVILFLLGLLSVIQTPDLSSAMSVTALSTLTPIPTSIKAVIPVRIEVAEGIRVYYFLANAGYQGEGGSDSTYEVVPGNQVKLLWFVSGAQSVYLATTNADSAGVLGPLPAEGSILVCPLSGQSYYVLYAGGLPNTVPGVGLGIWVPPSQMYPAYQGTGVPCWKH